jgi:hypothetical protein
LWSLYVRKKLGWKQWAEQTSQETGETLENKPREGKKLLIQKKAQVIYNNQENQGFFWMG